MVSIFDYIISLVIGGMILVMLLGLVGTIRTTQISQSEYTVVQSNLTAMTGILDADLRKAGYGMFKPPIDSAIKAAYPDSIILSGDFNNDGTPDQLSYYIGRVKPSLNENPHSRYLFRNFNSSISLMNVGLTKLSFVYYDTNGVQLNGSPISRPSRIGSVKVSVKLESISPTETAKETTYALASWEQLIRPMNGVKKK